MMDYAAWLLRAEQFVRGLDDLAGQWTVSIAVEPPLAKADADALDKSLPAGLPAPLYELYTRGAASFACRYHWTPESSRQPWVEKVFPDSHSLYGGARFIPATELSEALTGVRHWATGWDAEDGDPPRPGWEGWYESFPFLAVGNGDYLALAYPADGDRQPVLYLCHDALDGGDGRSAFEISPSFEQFLSDWEAICYVGPEIWLLVAFLADDGLGPLDVNQPKAGLWRDLIAPRRSGKHQKKPRKQ